MKNLVLVFLTSLTVLVKGQPEIIWQTLQDGSIIRWAYTDGDEFNGTSLKESVWSYHYPWQYSDCSEFYTDGNNYEFSYNSTIGSETIKLIAKEEPIQGHKLTYCPDGSSDIDNCLVDGSSNLRNYNYTSGMICSKRRFKYGLFEIRFKLPTGKGLVPAFWLFGGNPDEEFDIFEYKGETPNKIHIAVHHDGIIQPSKWVTANGNFSDGFNTMMGEWGSNAVFWYLNGHEFDIWLGNLNYQAYLIANLAVGAGSCAFSPPSVDSSTPFPAVFEIDYIRIWTRLDCEKAITITNYNQSLTDLTVITGQNINVSNTTLNQGQSLKLIATDVITIEPNTTIEGDFEAKIIECSGPTKKANITTNSEGSLNIIDSLLSDNIKDNRIEQKAASLENPSQLYTKIYPNPSDGKITIEFVGKLEQKIKIELIDITGEVVFTNDNIVEKYLEIDISHLIKGVYILKGVFDNNSVTEKIILK